MITKRFSKAKAQANRVTWTGLDAIPIPFHADGPMIGKRTLGYLRIRSRAMFCHGFRIMYDVPPGAARLQCNVSLIQLSSGHVMADLIIRGVATGGELSFPSPLFMPAESQWCFQARMTTAPDTEAYVPQGMTATYQARFAPGPAQTTIYSTSDQSVVITTPGGGGGGGNLDYNTVWLKSPTGYYRQLMLDANDRFMLGDPRLAPTFAPLGAYMDYKVVWLKRTDGITYRPLYLDTGEQLFLGDPTDGTGVIYGVPWLRRLDGLYRPMLLNNTDHLFLGDPVSNG